MPIVARKAWPSRSVCDGERLQKGLFASLWTRKQRKGGRGRTFTEDPLPPAGPHFLEAPHHPKRVPPAGEQELVGASSNVHPNKRF